MNINTKYKDRLEKQYLIINELNSKYSLLDALRKTDKTSPEIKKLLLNLSNDINKLEINIPKGNLDWYLMFIIVTTGSWLIYALLNRSIYKVLVERYDNLSFWYLHEFRESSVYWTIFSNYIFSNNIYIGLLLTCLLVYTYIFQRNLRMSYARNTIIVIEIINLLFIFMMYFHNFHLMQLPLL